MRMEYDFSKGRRNPYAVRLRRGAKPRTGARGQGRQEYEFDYWAAVRGKHYRRLLEEGARIVVLDPDVATAFRDSEAVNEALRTLLVVSERTRSLTARARGRSRRNRAAG